jgi:hypothetical protein
MGIEFPRAVRGRFPEVVLSDVNGEIGRSPAYTMHNVPIYRRWALALVLALSTSQIWGRSPLPTKVLCGVDLGNVKSDGT